VDRTVIKKHRSGINLILLCLFLFPTLLIHFLHSESSINGSNTCPACHFQNSTLTTAQVPVVILPQLELFEILRSIRSAHYNQIYYIQPSSRSPPLA
jgi:hypothetical protein